MYMKTHSAMRERAKNWPEVQDALWGNHFWSPSCVVISYGGAPLETVKKYIENKNFLDVNQGGQQRTRSLDPPCGRGMRTRWFKLARLSSYCK